MSENYLGPKDYDERIGGDDAATVVRDRAPVLLYRPCEALLLRKLWPIVPLLRRVPGWSEQRQAEGGIMGFLDASRGERYARATAFTRDFPHEWARLQPFLCALDAAYRMALPRQYALQLAFAKVIRPEWIIPGTVFSTVTVNALHRFPAHRDRGNLAHGMTAMTVWRQGAFSGGELIFPEWRRAVDMDCGDLLLFDGHALHGNAPFVGAGRHDRLSILAYLRAGLLKAGTLEQELNRAKSGR
jgi:hypothetical protein